MIAVPENPFADLDEYELQHLAEHLERADRAADLHRLLWLEERQTERVLYKRTGLVGWWDQFWHQKNYREEHRYANAWYKARERTRQMEGYSADVQRAWLLAEREEHPCYSSGKGEVVFPLVLQVRYALIATSLASLASNIPAELLAALVQKGVWPASQGLAYTRTMPEAKQRAEALASLAPHLPQELQPQALAIACEIKSAHARAQSLSSLLPFLPRNLQQLALQETLAAVHGLDDSYCAGILAQIAPYLAPESQATALAAAHEIRSANHRARALADMCGYLPIELHTQILPEVLATTREIETENDRAAVLTSLSPYLSEELLPEGLQISATIQSTSNHSRALVGLLSRSVEIGHPQEALATVQRIQDLHRRAAVMTGLAPHLPDELHPEVLKAIAAIQNEDDRAKALVSLAPKLSPELLPWALIVARGIKNERCHLKALTGLLPHLPAELKEQALREATTAARKLNASYRAQRQRPRMRKQALRRTHAPVQKRRWGQARTHITGHSRKLSDVGKHFLASSAGSKGPMLLLTQKPSDVEKHFLAAEQASKDSAYIAALVELAPQLPVELREHVLAEALSAARERQGQSAHFRDLISLALCLPPDLIEILSEILASILEIKGTNDRAKALAELAPHLPPELLQHALDATPRIQDQETCAQALAVLARHLSSKPCREALAAVRAITDQEGRDVGLASLSPRLAELGYPQEALTAASEIKSDRHRAAALVRLGVRLPSEFLDKVLSSVRGFLDTSCRAAVLTALTPRLPEGLLGEALAISRTTWSTVDSVRALAGLTTRLPTELREKVLQEALAAALRIKMPSDRARALVSLAAKSAELGYLHQALVTSRAIVNVEYRADSLVGLLPYLREESKAQILTEALEAARAIEHRGTRARMLARLAPEMPEEARLHLLVEALEVARATRGEDACTQALVDLAPLLPTELQEQVLAETLAATRSIEDTGERACALGQLASCLPEKERLLTLREALVTTREISQESGRTLVLSELAPNLPGELLTEALEATSGITERHFRAEALDSLAQYWSRWTQQNLRAAYAPWPRVLRILATGTRHSLISDLRLLDPVLVALGGVAAVEGVFGAIQDVGRWWP